MKTLILSFLLLLSTSAFAQGYSYSGGVTTSHGNAGVHTAGNTYSGGTSTYQNGGSYNYDRNNSYNTNRGRRGNDWGRGNGNRGRYNYGGGSYGYSGATSCATTTRIITQPSPCGTFFWKITQERIWTAGFWNYNRGCRVWVPGCWSWREICRVKVFNSQCGSRW